MKTKIKDEDNKRSDLAAEQAIPAATQRARLDEIVEVEIV
jgi:hypothetical protein